MPLKHYEIVLKKYHIELPYGPKSSILNED